MSIPITLYEVPATSISLFNNCLADVFNSPGTLEPTMITLFLPKFSFSVNIRPWPISKPRTLKFIGKYPLIFPLIFEFLNLICLLPFIAGAIIQLCSVFSANASASFITKGLNPCETPPLFRWLGNIDKVLGPRSSILASNAFSALDPIPITVMTAAVPIIIASAVKNDLTPFVLIDDTADFMDSSTNIIQY